MVGAFDVLGAERTPFKNYSFTASGVITQRSSFSMLAGPGLMCRTASSKSF
jgi:hypothetical protein